jgi:hypothetical protein
MDSMSARNWDREAEALLAELKAGKQERQKDREPVSEGVKATADRFNRGRGRYTRKVGSHYLTSAW